VHRHSGVDNRKIFEIERWVTTRRCPPYLATHPTLANGPGTIDTKKVLSGGSQSLIAKKNDFHDLSMNITTF